MVRVPFLCLKKHGLSMLSLHFKPMLLEDVANSRDFIIRCSICFPMPYGQRASSRVKEDLAISRVNFRCVYDMCHPLRFGLSSSICVRDVAIFKETS